MSTHVSFGAASGRVERRNVAASAWNAIDPPHAPLRSQRCHAGTSANIDAFTA
jgi:hypothetical protein